MKRKLMLTGKIDMLDKEFNTIPNRWSKKL